MFQEVDEAYKLTKKQNNGIIYTFYWHLGFAFANIFRMLRITPNIVSTFSLIFYILGGYFFLLGDGYNVLGGVFYFFGILMDCVDGKLARMTDRTSKLGIWLDYNYDYLRPLFLYPPIAISLQKNTGELTYIYLAFITVTATLVYTIIGMRWDGFEFARKHKQEFVKKSKLHTILKQFYFLEGIEPLWLLLLAFLNRLDIFLITWTLGMTFTYLFSTFYYGIQIHNRDLEKNIS